MKSALGVLLLALLAFTAFAQTTEQPVGEPDASVVGIDSAQQYLRDVTVTKFEDAGFWATSMPMDQGYIVSRRLKGSPIGKVSLDADRLQAEESLNISPGDNVLGVRVHFYKRGMNYFYISPMRPIGIEGICKTLSVWVVGRNFNHVLKIMITDYFGQLKELTLGKLNHTGWKKMTVAIPPNIVQTDYHYSDRNGIKFIGFKVESDLMESQGQYYIYFDDLSVTTDLFLESARDEDDMADIW